jgi:glycine hydroxymethyltransferase
MVNALEQYDPQIYELIRQEQARQSGSIRLIPSENYVSKAVMLASGSCLTNKYAEGYPGQRYYEGQQVTDLIEKMARGRVKKLFKADHANVQPYSGSIANWAAYLALVKPGDTIMGLSLPHGGHLTHGWKVSVTSKIFNSVPYTAPKSSSPAPRHIRERLTLRYSDK